MVGRDGNSHVKTNSILLRAKLKYKLVQNLENKPTIYPLCKPLSNNDESDYVFKLTI